MNAREFVAIWRREKDNFVSEYFAVPNKTLVGNKIASLKLNARQAAVLKEIVGDMLTDVFYTFLTGLDGTTSIGGVQQIYNLRDMSGHVISDDGDIEAEAYEQFHAAKNEPLIARSKAAKCKKSGKN